MQRYEIAAKPFKGSQNKVRYSTIYYPKVEPSDQDIYITVKISDRLDLLAKTYYDDPRLWIVIAKANNLHNGSIKPPVGMRLRIPYPLNYLEYKGNFNKF